MGKWVTENLPWIIASLATLFMGFLAGQVKVSAIELNIAELKARQEKDAALHECMIRHIDRLESGGTGPAPCQLGAK